MGYGDLLCSHRRSPSGRCPQNCFKSRQAPHIRQAHAHHRTCTRSHTQRLGSSQHLCIQLRAHHRSRNAVILSARRRRRTFPLSAACLDGQGQAAVPVARSAARISGCAATNHAWIALDASVLTSVAKLCDEARGEICLQAHNMPCAWRASFRQRGADGCSLAGGAMLLPPRTTTKALMGWPDLAGGRRESRLPALNQFQRPKFLGH